LHTVVVIVARDRKGLRRLAGTIARPWSDGTTALELSSENLAERLVALVPPPRANRVLYGGVLASPHRTTRPKPPRQPKLSRSGHLDGSQLGHPATTPRTRLLPSAPRPMSPA
jgi:hypothetical protein